MINKKLSAVVLTTVLSASLLAGCAKKEEPAPTTPPATETPATETPATEVSAYKDGTYKTEYDNLDTKGWKAFVEIVVSGGKIASCNYDYVNADGNLKSKDADYNANMLKGSGTNPEKAYPALDQALVNAQGLEGFQAVTGATHSSDTFKELVTIALENAKSGNTTVAVVAQPDIAAPTAYKDGTFRAEYDKADTRGWKAFVEAKVEGGKITSVQYDYVNADGKLKTQDADYNTNMKKGVGTSPEEAFPVLDKMVVDNQGLNNFTVVTGATTSSDSFKELITSVITNAKEGKTDVVVLPQPDVAK